MPRPATYTDEQMLDAALEAFVELGFAATTTEIARRAGVSEGTLFKRFHSKEELFLAAMRPRGQTQWLEGLAGRVGQGELRAHLTEIGLNILRGTREFMPRLMAVWSRGSAVSLSEAFGESPVLQELKPLTAYLHAEIALGRMRAVDTDLLIETLLGAIGHQVRPRASVTETELTDRQFIEGLIDLLWSGVTVS
jgi:AcrR family transcriptional regulator